MVDRECRCFGGAVASHFGCCLPISFVVFSLGSRSLHSSIPSRTCAQYPPSRIASSFVVFICIFSDTLLRKTISPRSPPSSRRTGSLVARSSSLCHLLITGRNTRKSLHQGQFYEMLSWYETKICAGFRSPSKVTAFTCCTVPLILTTDGQ